MTYIHVLSRERGTTFFITSHRLEEMESVCTTVGVLDRGRIVAQGAPMEVARAIVPEIRVRVVAAPGASLDLEALARLEGALEVSQDAGGAVVRVDGRDRVPQTVRAIAAMPTDLLGVAEDPPTLEEAYLRLVQRQEQP